MSARTDELIREDVQELEGKKILQRAKEAAEKTCDEENSWSDNWDHGPAHNHSD